MGSAAIRRWEVALLTGEEYLDGVVVPPTNSAHVFISEPGIVPVFDAGAIARIDVNNLTPSAGSPNILRWNLADLSSVRVDDGAIVMTPLPPGLVFGPRQIRHR